MTVTTTPRLEGSPNFRDVGGLRGLDGRAVKTGRVYRSGNFSRITAADVEALRRLSLRTIVDLRSEMEVQMYPSALPANAEVAVINLVTNPYANAGAADYKKILADDPTPRGALKTVDATYSLLPPACGPALRLVAECVLDGRAPVVFHCSHGRDRTGLVSMVLQHLLGVSRKDIVANFVESNARIDLEAAVALSRKVFIKEYGIEFDDKTLRTMNQALAPSVEVAFATMEQLYGSVEDYAVAFGITRQQQQALRDALLEGDTA